MEKFRWIDENVAIDFKVPKVVENTIKLIEKYDIEDNWVMYFDACDSLENLTKDLVYFEYITYKQREILLKKYS